VKREKIPKKEKFLHFSRELRKSPAARMASSTILMPTAAPSLPLIPQPIVPVMTTHGRIGMRRLSSSPSATNQQLINVNKLNGRPSSSMSTMKMQIGPKERQQRLNIYGVKKGRRNCITELCHIPLGDRLPLHSGSILSL
jgi:hypothetical protein